MSRLGSSALRCATTNNVFAGTQGLVARIEIECNRANLLYLNGEKADFTVHVYDGDKLAESGTVEVRISKDGSPGSMTSKVFDLSKENPVRCSDRMTESCFCLVQAWAGKTYTSKTVWYRTPEQAEWLIHYHQLAGSRSSVNAEIIAPADLERPADFDKFWTCLLKKACELPYDMQMEKMPDFSNTRATYYRISMNTLNNEYVHGYLGVPVGKGPFPVMALFPGAGPGWGEPIDCGYTAAGCITVMLNVHKYPVPANLEEAKKRMNAYAEKHHAPGYLKAGISRRETYHFYTVLPGFFRVLEYVTENFSWDGKRCIMVGSSQGGWMSLCMAALHRKKVTAVYAGVPAVGLNSRMRTDKDGLKLNIPPYFEPDYHAPNIKATAFVVAGMRDTSCPAPTVIAMFGLLGSKDKKLIIEPYSEHIVTPDRQDQEQNFIMAQLRTIKIGEMRHRCVRKGNPASCFDSRI